jgi:hypothetical protein
MTINEPMGMSETVIVVVGDPVAPNDMQCEAKVGKSRCKNEKVLINHAWSTLCKKHSKQNDEARMNKAEKVKLYEG